MILCHTSILEHLFLYQRHETKLRQAQELKHLPSPLAAADSTWTSSAKSGFKSRTNATHLQRQSSLYTGPRALVRKRTKVMARQTLQWCCSDGASYWLPRPWARCHEDQNSSIPWIPVRLRLNCSYLVNCGDFRLFRSQWRWLGWFLNVAQACILYTSLAYTSYCSFNYSSQLKASRALQTIRWNARFRVTDTASATQCMEFVCARQAGLDLTAAFLIAPALEARDSAGPQEHLQTVILTR